MSWAQHCVGTSTPALQDVTTKWPHFKAKWLNSLRNYLQDIGGQIQLHQHGVCKLQRVNDEFIMNEAIAGKKFGPTALRRINYCQMYLNILLLSDIALPSGKLIDPAAYEGDQDALHSFDPGHSVHQNKPNAKAWMEWKKCLHLFCHKDLLHTLKEPLKECIVPPKRYARQWNLLYSEHEDAIYHHTALEYSVHRKLRHDYDQDMEEFVDKLPNDAVPIARRETTHAWIQPRTLITQDLPLEQQHRFRKQSRLYLLGKNSYCKTWFLLSQKRKSGTPYARGNASVPQMGQLQSHKGPSHGS